MKKTRSFYLILLFRVILIALAVAGLCDTMFSKSGGFMGASSLCYYTIQSNIWVMLLTVAAIVFSIRGKTEPDWFCVMRFVLTVAILVTFLVFWTMLSYTMEASYLITVSNLTLHTLVPLMTMADTLFFDRGFLPSRCQLLFCAIPPLAYFAFAMVRAEVGGPLGEGGRYPYWFLDVDTYGWFGFRGGPGVFWWVLVVIVIVLALGVLLRFAGKKLPGGRSTRAVNTPSDDGRTR